MNRRDILKGILAAPIAGAASALPKQAEAKPFEPDYYLTKDSFLFCFADAFLDGQKVSRKCFEAHVSWESFERPAYGVLIVAASRPGVEYAYTTFFDLRDDEAELDGLIVKRVTGQVQIKLTERGREEYEKLRAALKSEQEYSDRVKRVLGR